MQAVSVPDEIALDAEVVMQVQARKRIQGAPVRRRVRGQAQSRCGPLRASIARQRRNSTDNSYIGSDLRPG